MTNTYRLWNKDENWNDELNEAWANLGEHGFDKEATYVSRKDASMVGLDDVRMHHWLITIERRDGWDGMEPHFRVGYWNAVHESASKFAGQWLTDEAQQKEIDWDWTCDYAELYEMEYKTWDDLLNDNGFKPLDIHMEKIAIETKSLNKCGMTRYELCWDTLHDRMCKKRKTIHGGGWPSIVLEMMNDIEDEILGPQEE